MKPITKSMVRMYNITDVDFLGYACDNPKQLTYHHIQKTCDGGASTYKNGAVLTKTSHNYLHIIEPVMPVIYQGLNFILKEVNERGTLLTLEEAYIVDDLFKHFEAEYWDACNHKGMRLIRPSFITQREQGISRILRRY